MSQIKFVVEQRSRKRWAAVGFLLIVALTVIAWFLAPSVLQWVRSANSDFRAATRTMPAWQLQAAFTLLVLVILLGLSAIIVTLAAPRKAINVKETDLVKERGEAVKYHRMQKKRQRRLNREMREYVEKNQRQ